MPICDDDDMFMKDLLKSWALRKGTRVNVHALERTFTVKLTLEFSVCLESLYTNILFMTCRIVFLFHFFKTT